MNHQSSTRTVHPAEPEIRQAEQAFIAACDLASGYGHRLNYFQGCLEELEALEREAVRK